MTALSVNLNKVALLRNQRSAGYPSVVEMAKIALKAGAHGITVHPRPDERHIRRHDVFDLSKVIKEHNDPNIEFNIEGYPTEDFINLVLEVRADQVTLVPDTPDQRTSDHGWDVIEDADFLTPPIAKLKAAGIRTSLFIDHSPVMAEVAAETGCDRVELYTEPYDQAFGSKQQGTVLEAFFQTAQAARAKGLGVNAGHDLNLKNLRTFLQNIDFIDEVSIGHALIADALVYGMEETIKKYLSLTTVTK